MKPNRSTMRALGAAALALAALQAIPAGAQALQDPTRPAVGGPAGEGAGESAAAPQLQSVLIGRAPGSRRVAVIDGETVKQGESFRGALVARVSDTEVELVKGRERQVLRLYAQDASTSAGAPVAHR